MGKRKRKTQNKSDNEEEVEMKKSKKEYSRSSSSSSESSSSDSSSDSGSDRKHRKRKKSRHSKNCKTCMKKLQKKLDIFTQNIDIKLNYMENLIQTLIKSQNASTKPVQKLRPPSVVNIPQISSPLESKKEIKTNVQTPKPVSLSKEKRRESTPVLFSQATETPGSPLRDEEGNMILPHFPMETVEEFLDFDKRLLNNEYMKFVVESLYQNCNSIKADRITLRVKRLLYGITTGDLLNEFSWTGRSTNAFGKKRENATKNAISNCRGIVELTRQCVDFESSKKTAIYELITAFKECVKRNTTRLARADADELDDTQDNFMDNSQSHIDDSEPEEKFQIVMC